MTQLTEAHLDQLFQMRQQAADDAIGYWRIYETLASWLTTQYGVSASDPTVLWLQGATEANAGRGAMSELIRTYTNTQYRLRYGGDIPAGRLQDASDAVASNLLRDLFGENPEWMRGRVPDITQIASADATAVGRVLFNVDPQDSAAEQQANSAWSGALLFGLLRSDQTSRLLSTGTAGQLDTLNDLRDVLFAFSAYVQGLKAAASSAASSFLAAAGGSVDASIQLSRDSQVLLTTFAALPRAHEAGFDWNQFDWNQLAVNLTSNAVLKAAFRSIAIVGPERFVDMLMGADLGRPLLGATTEATFETNAHDFFSRLNPAQLQALQVRMLPTTGAALAEAALTDVNVRVALAALSVVSVQVASDVAARFTLYDPSIETGEISEAWITDRAAMTSRVAAAGWSSTAVITGQGNFDYRDLASGARVQLGAVDPNQRVQIIFGSNADEVLAGLAVGDRLYGGAGNDSVSSLGGADYLEGNAGDDVLDGGEGNDTLAGGTGNDTYAFDSTFNRDMVIDGDGSGSITWDGNPLPQGLRVFDGLWQSADRQVTYVLSKNLPDAFGVERHDLIISFAGSTNRIIIRGWNQTDRNLGISFGGDIALPATTHNVLGDFEKKLKLDEQGNPTRFYEFVGDNYVSNGVQVGARDQITGTFANEAIYGLGGDDAILGRGGDDLIFGGDGGDVLQGGLGRDRILGEAGSDIIYGSSAGQLPNPTRDDFAPPLPPAGATVTAVGFNWLATAPVGGGLALSSSVGRDDGLGDSGNDIDAGAGIDFVAAGQGDDVVTLGEGNDTVYGMAGSDHVLGGMGDDFIIGDGPAAPDTVVDAAGVRHGADVLVGDTGNDTLVGQGNDDILLGGADDDLLYGDDSVVADTPAEFHGADLLLGGSGHDSLIGGGRDDELHGEAGNDMLWGDSAYAGTADPGYIGPAEQGNDTLYGGGGNDSLYGEGGSDLLLGGEGADWLYGDEGNDTLEGGIGYDTLIGGDGADRLTGGAGADLVIGGEGNDTLVGGGADSLLGGTGVDTYVVASADLAANSSLIIDDQAEGNKLQISGGVVLQQASNDGVLRLLLGNAADGKVLVLNGGLRGSVENLEIDGQAITAREWIANNVTQALSLGGFTSGTPVYSGGGNDTLGGSDFDDRLYAAGGADFVFADEGADLVEGGAGQDTLNGGLGDDTIVGGLGNDELVGGAGSDVFRFGRGDGQDLIRDMYWLGGANGISTLELGPEISPADIRFRQVYDTDRLTTSALEVSIAGTSDAVRINGFFSSSQGGAGEGGAQQLRFADGTVWDRAAIQALVFAGTDGNDFISGTDSNDSISGGAGSDSLSGGGGQDTLNGGVGHDSLSGGDGLDSLNGGRGRDTLDGDAGNDTLNGDDGDDALFGGDGNDLLQGGADYDQLGGGEGADTLDGGGGRRYGKATPDFLSGGSGDDTYRFAAGHGGDYVSEFGGVDTIEFAAGIDPGGVGVRRVGNDLLISAPHADVSVTVGSFFELYGPTSARLVELVRFADGTTWNTAQLVAMSMQGTDGAEWLYGVTSADTIVGGGGNDLIDGAAGGDSISGGAGNDTLWGEDGNDTLDGGSGNDTLSGGLGNDRLIGGRGNDFFSGGEGADAYIFAAGDGRDTLSPWHLEGYAADRLEFGSGISASSLLAFRDGSDLVFRVPGSTDQLVASGFYSPGYADANGTPRGFAAVRFEDGTVWTTADLLTRASQNPLPAGQALNGNSSAESLVGGAGKDTIVAGAGDDTLAGGAGDDTLDGGAGVDTILFDRGSGYDTLVRGDGSPGNVDEVRFGAGIAAADLAVTRDGDDLVVVIVGSGDALRLIGFCLVDPIHRTDRFVLADGTVLSAQQIAASIVDGGDGSLRLGTSGPDTLNGASGEDRLLGGAGGDVIVGHAGADWLAGQDGADQLSGGAQNDTLRGDAGNDTLDGGTGDDLLDGGLGNDTYHFDLGSGHDIIESLDTTPGKVDVLRLGSGITPDNLVVHADRFASNDDLTLRVRGASDTMEIRNYFTADGTSGNQIERIVFADGTVWDVAEVIRRAMASTGESDLIRGSATSDTVDGGDGDDLMYGNGGNDTLRGMTGADSLYGGAGADVLSGGDHDDWVEAGDGNDNILGDAGNDKLLGDDGDDRIDGGTGNDTLDGREGRDTLHGGTGDDLLLGREGDDVYIFNRGDGVDDINGGFDGSRDIVQLGSGITPSDLIVRRSQIDWNTWLEVSINGTTDLIKTRQFFDFAGALLADPAISEIRFADGTSWDAATIAAQATKQGVLGSDHADSIVGTGADEFIRGLGGNDTIQGGGGSDRIDGGSGADQMAGGVGDDEYVVDSAADSVNEGVNAGTDTVYSSLSWSLGDNLEILVLNGSAAINASGNSLANVLRGNQAANVLDGAAGPDTMAGGDGDDVYVVGDAGDSVTERPDQGIDQVMAAVTFVLGENVEHLTLTGSGAINGTGNASANLIVGNAAANTLVGNGGNDTLDGGVGNDSLVGGAGDDTYVIDSAGDLVTESANGGNDTIRSAVTITLSANVEQLVLLGTSAINGTGNSANNVLRGNSAANALNGGAGADTLIGGAGDDSYTVDNPGDVVTELVGEGMDLVNSSITWTLGANLENLTLTGSGAINGAGNSLDNVLRGNSGSNVLTGGAGNDIYIVGAGDSVVENANEGTDSVESSVTLLLSDNLENLTLTGTAAINGTGNALANSLTGNSSANVLDGGAGGDTMVGGAGNDTYMVDSAGDVVTEAVSGGTDLVMSSVAYTLGAEVENLTLTGTDAISGTGNASANNLTGNAAANWLDGGTGNDTMAGGAGDDTYVVDGTGDVVTEGSNAGTDTVLAAVSWTLGSNVESLTLTGTAHINGTGNTLANAIRGNAGNNVLSGGSGNDTMVGGAGNDTYVVDATGDVVTELAGEGVDLINSSAPYTLPVNVENLTLTGTAVINGTGNTLNNVLTGNGANNTLTGGAGNDTLDGGAGNDTMVGGVGDDTYVVNVTTDVVTEALNEGVDTVRSSVTLTLGNNVENLQLQGTSALNGTGNALNNVLTGNSAANTLTGAAGNDTLDGAAGNDSLVGGAGADTYRFGLGYGTDTISENDTTASTRDVVEFTGSLTQTSIQFRRVGNNLEATILASSDRLVLQNWYVGAQHQVEEFRFSDGTVLTNVQVQSAALSAPATVTAQGAEFVADEGYSSVGRKQVPVVTRGVAMGSVHLREGVVAVAGVQDLDDSLAFGPVRQEALATGSGRSWLDSRQGRAPGSGMPTSMQTAVRSIDQQLFALLDAMAVFDSGIEASTFAPLQDSRPPLDRLAANVPMP